jgi:hypothetical protein
MVKIQKRLFLIAKRECDLRLNVSRTRVFQFLLATK